MTFLAPKLNGSTPEALVDWAKRLIVALEQDTGVADPYNQYAVAPYNVKVGLPTATEIPDGEWAVFKNSTDGKIYVAANSGGTIKKVELV